MLTRDDIIEVIDIRVEEVSVPEWGGNVCIKTLTGEELDYYQAGIVKMRGQTSEVNMLNMRAKLVALGVCNVEGKRLFSSDADVKILAAKSAAALNRLFMAIQRLNGLSDEEVEEISKN